MSSKPLGAIEKTNLVLALAVTALGGLVWGKAGFWAAGVGAALACLNLWAIHRLAAKAIARAAAGATAAATGVGCHPCLQSRPCAVRYRNLDSSCLARHGRAVDRLDDG